MRAQGLDSSKFTNRFFRQLSTEGLTVPPRAMIFYCNGRDMDLIGREQRHCVVQDWELLEKEAEARETALAYLNPISSTVFSLNVSNHT